MGERPVPGSAAGLLVVFHQSAHSLPGLRSWLLNSDASTAGSHSLSVLESDAGALPVELQARLDDNEQARVVIVYPNPASALARELHGGKPSAHALETWKKSAAAPLELFRRNRRRVMLLDGHAAQSDRPGLVDAWRQHTGLLLNVPLAAAGEELEEYAPVEWFAAQHLLKHDQEANLLVAELEASSLPLTFSCTVDVEGLLKQWRSAASADAQPLQDLREENQLLHLQLQQVQQELESTSNAHRQLQAQRSNTSDTRVRDLRGKLKQVREELRWAQQDLVEMRQSLSWKITAPLRRVFGLLKRG